MDKNVKHHAFDTLDSTHLWCKSQKQTIDQELLKYDYVIVSTQEQTSGVGRRLRPWQAKRGDIAFNICLRDPINSGPDPHPTVTKFSLSAAFSTYKLLKINHVNTKIKWPNDLMSEKGKLGAVMIERLQSDNGSLLLIGVGINVIEQKEGEFQQEPYENPRDWTSNWGFLPDPYLFCEELAQEIYLDLHKLKINDFDLQEIENISYFQKGDLVEFFYSKEKDLKLYHKATILSCEPSGNLLLKLENGELISLTSGECYQIRSSRAC